MSWEKVRAQAVEILEHRKERNFSKKDYDQSLLLWEYPAFYPCHSWMLFFHSDNLKEGQYGFMHKMTWEQVKDFRSYHDPVEEAARRIQHRDFQPTIMSSEADVPANGLAELLVRGRKITIPLIRNENIIGTDGVSYGLKTGGAYNNIAIKWWCDGPDEWKPFTEWFHELREFLDNCVIAQYERLETFQAVKEGIEDVNTGRVKPAREALEELRRKHEL